MKSLPSWISSVTVTPAAAGSDAWRWPSPLASSKTTPLTDAEPFAGAAALGDGVGNRPMPVTPLPDKTVVVNVVELTETGRMRSRSWPSGEFGALANAVIIRPTGRAETSGASTGATDTNGDPWPRSAASAGFWATI